MAADAELDHEAVMASRHFLRAWELEATDLRRRFEVRLPGDDGSYLFYA